MRSIVSRPWVTFSKVLSVVPVYKKFTFSIYFFCLFNLASQVDVLKSLSVVPQVVHIYAGNSLSEASVCFLIIATYFWFSKVLSVVPLYRKFTRPLTFENVCQIRVWVWSFYSDYL